MPEIAWAAGIFDFPQPETCKDQSARDNLGRLAFLIFRNRKPAKIKMPEIAWAAGIFDFPQPETCKDQNARDSLGDWPVDFPQPETCKDQNAGDNLGGWHC